MKVATKIGIVALLIAAAVVVVVIKQTGSSPSAVRTTDRPTDRSGSDEAQAALPRLVDLGAGKCMACKMMTPVLNELKDEYKGRLVVEVLDIGDDPALIEVFNIRVIPTQIFYDAADNELYRHEGFMSKSDIVAKWKELGIVLD